MSPDVRRLFGNRGENLASSYLKKKGMRILDRQYRTKLGEIDLVCQDGEEIVFVEVKTRRTDTYGHPEESITPEKILRILRVIEQYLQEKRKEDHPWRVDVIAIQMKEEAEPEIVHFEAIDMPQSP